MHRHRRGPIRRPADYLFIGPSRNSKMNLNKTRARQLLATRDLSTLFVEEMGWDRHSTDVQVTVGASKYSLVALAHKRGMVAYQYTAPAGASIPNYPERRKIERQVAKSTH